MQPLDLRRGAVEPGEIHLQAEHPPHQHKQSGVVVPGGVDLNAECARRRLVHPRHCELGRVAEPADIGSIRREHIDQVGRQPA
jgi:hypothetical protein